MSAAATIRKVEQGPLHAASETHAEAPVTRKRHINWALKAILPIAAVLLNGLLLFIMVTLSLESDTRHAIITVAAAGAIVICAAVIVVFSVAVRRPMLELQDKIARVSLGDLNTEVSFANRNDEIGDLGRDFNDMVAQLKASREEIHRLHHTQMSRAEHFATLGELAAGLAHEIRNPLAGIAGVIEIVSRDLPPDSPACDVIKDAKEEAVQINRILTDLLETARPKPPHFVVRDLSATVEHAVTFARQQAVTKQITIELDKGDLLPPVDHDPNQINQVLLNLLLNAIQAMTSNPPTSNLRSGSRQGPSTLAPGPGKRGGSIYVSLRREREHAVISVADEGHGIAAENLANIFRPFFTTKGHGTGLGLSLARRIVEAHRGTITVRSELGSGTEFMVRLPITRSPASGTTVPADA